ncbi:MAG: hypothetical protein MJ246_01700 [Clostridia bacterium]|nr:hypothetical protein [Clostridia bacterium]
MIKSSELIQEAKNAMTKSFVPFSKMKVGAAVQTSNDKVYTGIQRDLDAYNTREYSERCAIKEAYQNGDKKITKIVIASDTEEFAYPEGSSLQMIYDFAPHADLIFVNKNDDMACYTIKDLYPYPAKRI